MLSGPYKIVKWKGRTVGGLSERIHSSLSSTGLSFSLVMTIALYLSQDLYSTFLSSPLTFSAEPAIIEFLAISSCHPAQISKDTNMEEWKRAKLQSPRSKSEMLLC